MSRARIGHWMTRNPVTLSPETEITRATSILIHNSISGAPVLDDIGRLVGVLSSKDCFRAVLHAHYYQEPGKLVSHYMTREVVTLDAGLDIVSAAERFIETSYRRFPVMDDGRLAGVISRNDLLRAFQVEGAD